jgi:hypothetical protein
MLLAMAMIVAAAGCSTLTPTRETRHIGHTGVDLHGATPLHLRRARALVSGPALVQRLETDGDGSVALYLADDPGIRDRGCPSAAAENVAPLAVLGQQSRLADVVVPRGKRICAATVDQHPATITWQAHAGSESHTGPFDLALLAR